jgi:hypothetical protein
MAFLTIEMHVEVVIVLLCPMTEAQFIAHTALPVFYRMYEMMVAEEHQGAEDAAFVHAPQLFFEFGERQRPFFFSKRFDNENAVACRLDAVFT